MQARSDAAGEWVTSRILVVDDDVELCELVQQYLGSQGFHVDAVHDGSTGVTESLSNSYDLVILDVMLPGIRGFEALRQIRAKSTVPVGMERTDKEYGDLFARSGFELSRVIPTKSAVNVFEGKPV